MQVFELVVRADVLGGAEEEEDGSVELGSTRRSSST